MSASNQIFKTDAGISMCISVHHSSVGSHDVIFSRNRLADGIALPSAQQPWTRVSVRWTSLIQPSSLLHNPTPSLHPIFLFTSFSHFFIRMQYFFLLSLAALFVAVPTQAAPRLFARQFSSRFAFSEGPLIKAHQCIQQGLVRQLGNVSYTPFLALILSVFWHLMFSSDWYNFQQTRMLRRLHPGYGILR